jgi:hypothetical protein
MCADFAPTAVATSRRSSSQVQLAVARRHHEQMAALIGDHHQRLEDLPRRNTQ